MDHPKRANNRKKAIIVATTIIVITVASIAILSSPVDLQKNTQNTVKKDIIGNQFQGPITRQSLASVREFKTEFVSADDSSSTNANSKMLELGVVTNADFIPRNMKEISEHILSSRSYSKASSSTTLLSKDKDETITGIGYAWMGHDTKLGDRKASGLEHLRGYLVLIHKQALDISSSETATWHVESAGFTEIKRTSMETTTPSTNSDTMTKTVYCISDASLRELDDVIVQPDSEKLSPFENLLAGENPLEQSQSSKSTLVIDSNSIRVSGVKYVSGHDLHPLGVTKAVYFELLEQNDPMCHGAGVAGTMVTYNLQNNTDKNANQ